MDTKKVAVIIPFYKGELSQHENMALQQCYKILHNYPVIAVKPQSLALPSQIASYPFFDIVDFADEYFSDLQAYNRLMLDDLFYKQFLAYEYILIYQLDAFVFKDELDYWCSQNLDYVGAPWIKPSKASAFKWALNKFQYYFHTRYNIYKCGLPSKKQSEYKVGNGGFSLRRTAAFYKICLSHREKINYYNSHDHHLFNEDVFWSVEVNRIHKMLNIPTYKTALKFAFEFFPGRAFVLNHQQLPFGCHAWECNLDFWRPVFQGLGYTI